MRTWNHNRRIWMEKGKQATGLRNPTSVVRIRKEKFMLSLTIHVVEGVDPVSKYPGVTRRDYKVYSWIDPEDRYQTGKADGLRRVRFDEEIHIPFYKDSDVPLGTIFVSLEVARLQSYCDPGPSRGPVVVGRLRVPLPKELFLKKSNRYGLSRFVEGKILGEGHIGVSMKVIPYYDEL